MKFGYFSEGFLLLLYTVKSFGVSGIARGFICPTEIELLLKDLPAIKDSAETGQKVESRAEMIGRQKKQKFAIPVA